MDIGIDEARDLVRDAAMAAGANARTAASLADATVAAEIAGHPSVGLAHLPDYLEGFASGRIAGAAEPNISFPTPTTIRVDARAGIAQLGFDLTFDRLVDTTKRTGVGLFLQAGSYTAGELGYYTRRLAEANLVAFAASNGPALVTTAESGVPVFGTNPLSFAAPTADGRPLVIDQASSAAAFVKVREAVSRGETIPEAWALDAAGRPTTDPREALSGVLLAFGGARGANIALMVEVLAAGLTGADWSLDAPSFVGGTESPGAGLFVAAFDPAGLAPNLPARLTAHAERLAARGIYVPGRQPPRERISIEPSLFAAIARWRRSEAETPRGGPVPSEPSG